MRGALDTIASAIGRLGQPQPSGIAGGDGAGPFSALDAATRRGLLRDGLLWLLLDCGLFALLHRSHGAGEGATAMSLAGAHLASFALSAALLSPFWSERVFDAVCRGAPRRNEGLARSGFALVCLLAALARGGVLAFAVERLGLPALLAMLPASALAIGLGLIGSGVVARAMATKPSLDVAGWSALAFAGIAFLIGLRAIYLPLPSLLPDEAYYWQYAQHPALGYLDHPPGVAWSIWISTALFGDSEWALRLPAFALWIVAAGYVGALARNLFDDLTALAALLLFSALPVFFSVGFVITPDILNVATWAALLYYCERALLAGEPRAWWGVGIALGLGMLSKYTIALLGPAILIFVLVDRDARRWLLRPQPYLAFGTFVVLFMPVLIWNHQNDWVSFVFQSSRRVEIPSEFSLDWLMVHVMILLTPTGFLTVLLTLMGFGKSSPAPHDGEERARRTQRFVWIFTLLPFSVFVVFSLTHYPRFHWTGPIWLAVLPSAASWVIMGESIADPLRRGLRWLWQPTLVLLALLYAGALHYVVLGLPGVGYPREADYYFWREAMPVIEHLYERIEEEYGEPPVIVGMSKWSITSVIEFYDQDDSLGPVAARNLFGCAASMYETWRPAEAFEGRPVLLIAHQRRTLRDDFVEDRLEGARRPRGRPVERAGELLRRLRFRVADRYLGPVSPHGIDPPPFECGTAALVPGAAPRGPTIPAESTTASTKDGAVTAD